MNLLKQALPIPVQYRLATLRRFPEWYFGHWRHATSKRLSELKHKYRGERCIIMGNGPSLRNTDFSLLENEYTFGLNRINLLFDHMEFVPTFHVVVNRYVIEQFSSELFAIPAIKFMSWSARDLIPSNADVALLRSLPYTKFHHDISWGIWEGATVTFVAMQIAFYLGFEQVVLIGVDHSFATKGPAHKAVVSSGDDPNHFAPNYFGKGVTWQLPDLETSELAYKLAKEAFESDGREIVDATLDGKLQVFRKVNLHDILTTN